MNAGGNYDFSGLPLPGSDDTIVALASPSGRGALAAIRMSGTRAFEIARSITTPWPRESRRVALCAIADGSGTLLDRALVTIYHGPHSYTGEDIVEFSTHGGVLVPSTIIAALLERGARQATAGEFTRRAVLNGKLNVAQAEAVADLIDARSRRAQEIALAQLDGGLSRRISGLRSVLLETEALLAYDIDFPEEDDGPVSNDRISEALTGVIMALDDLLATVSIGELVREGAVVVLAGAPNVGKSSLFNALLGQSRAIVTDVPGTTRDALEAVVDAGQWALRLVDTAGLRVTSDPVERMGIEMSERYLDRAAIVLACGDDPESMEAAVKHVRLCTDAPIVAACTKSDIRNWSISSRDIVSARYQIPGSSELVPMVAVSAESSTGLEDLVGVILEVLSADHGELPADAPVLTRSRHQRVVTEARWELQEFHRAWADESLPAPVAATHLRSAVVALEEMIGVVDADDILDRVFSTFCVGK